MSFINRTQIQPVRHLFYPSQDIVDGQNDSLVLRWHSLRWHSETVKRDVFALWCGFCRLQDMSKLSEQSGTIHPYSPNLHCLLFSHGTCQGRHTRPKVGQCWASCMFFMLFYIRESVFIMCPMCFMVAPRLFSLGVNMIPNFNSHAWNDFKWVKLERTLTNAWEQTDSTEEMENVNLFILLVDI